MIAAAFPSNEVRRLAELERYRIVDSAAEPAFDEIVRLIASVCEAPSALVCFVASSRQWIKGSVGFAGRESSREESFCAHALLTPDRLTIVPDARCDPRFAENPFVTGEPHIRFYAAVPLVTPDGFALGTLCIIDTKPRFITTQQEDALRVGGQTVSMLLELRRTVVELQAATNRQQRIEADLRAEIDQRQHVERQLSFSSSHDGLTRLANRNGFMAQVDAALQRVHSAARERFAVYCINIDRFKNVNDSLGCSAGDELLVEVSRRLNEVIRDGDAVARVGGDEFTMLIGDADGEETAQTIARRIAAAILSPKITAGGVDFDITASIGVCLVDDRYSSVEDIVRDADIALYASKNRGRNRCTVFTPALRDEFAAANRTYLTLRRALERGQFQLAYQPIVSLQNAHAPPRAFEALLRLECDDGQLQSAAQFIETAEQTGVIVELGEWVLREACAQAARWQREYADPVVITVNVSAKQLAEPDFAAQVKSVIAAAQIDPHALAIEVTESVLIADVEASVAILRELREFGVKIYLDDFGTGYSSLSYLRSMPVDRIKIDRSFVSGAPGEGLADSVIVDSIISLAHKLDVEVVAEGVETDAQRSALANLGCDWAQGWLFSHAVPAAEAAGHLQLRSSTWDNPQDVTPSA